MKLLLKVLLGLMAFSLVITPMVATTAYAQDDEDMTVTVDDEYIDEGTSLTPFPDVPQNHWAFECIQHLRKYWVGFPDGEFKGNRTFTRYEFACFVARFFDGMNVEIEGQKAALAELDDQRRTIEAKLASLDSNATELKKKYEADLANVNAQLKDQAGKIATLRSDVDKLITLSNEFKDELSKLKVKVDTLSKKVDALTADVAGLRKDVDMLLARHYLDIRGDLMFAVIGSHSISDRFALDLGGKYAGANYDNDYDSNLGPVGLTKNIEILHDLGLNIRKDFGNNVSMYGEFIVSNYLQFLEEPITIMDSEYRPSTNETEVSVWQAYVNFKVGPANATVGRYGKMVTPYTYARIKPNYYIDSARYDDGKIYADGAELGFDWGNVALDVWGGINDNIDGTEVEGYQTIFAGMYNLPFDFGYVRPAGYGLNKQVDGDGYSWNYVGIAIRESLGANLRAKLGNSANVGLTYIVLDGGEDYYYDYDYDPDFNRVTVLGANADVQLTSALKLDAEFAQSNMSWNSDSVQTKDNYAIDGKLTYDVPENLKLAVGYKEIRPYFSAPGAWGRIGFWYNPTDIKGFTFDATYKGFGKLELGANGGMYTGTGRVGWGLSTDDKVNHFQVNAKYNVSDIWSLNVGWEGVYWDLEGRIIDGDSYDDITLEGGKPQENYYTIGMNYQLSDDAALKLMYQVIDYNAKGVNWFDMDTASDDKGKAGVLVTQVTVSF